MFFNIFLPFAVKCNNCCQKCGWGEVPGVLEIHHIDRNSKNNKQENLQVLCPNCHSIDHFKAQDGNYGKGWHNKKQF